MAIFAAIFVVMVLSKRNGAFLSKGIRAASFQRPAGGGLAAVAGKSLRTGIDFYAGK
jgi:hypothetical protein